MRSCTILSLSFSAIAIASEYSLCSFLPSGCPTETTSQPQLSWDSLKQDVGPQQELDINSELENVLESKPDTLDPIQAPPSSWSFNPECIQRRGSEIMYCIFTNSSFAANRGVSIFTTPEHAEQFTRLHAFTNPIQSSAANSLSGSSYIVKQVPGHGVGVVANRTIFRGERIMSNSPVLLIHDAVLDQFVKKDYSPFQNRAVQRLPEHTRHAFMDLDGQFGGDPVSDIIDTNSFSVNIFGESDPNRSPYTIVVPEISRFNHDCRPNAYYHFDLMTLTHHVQASRIIHEGEEITISYIPQLQTRKERQASLKEHWGFPCDCRLCSALPALAAASDARIVRINELRMRLLDYSSHAKVTPSMAELLVSLYEQENMWGPINEAYALAAIEFNAVGRPIVAEKYARLAVEAGLIYRGAEHKDVMDMESLLDNPRAHWSWKLRWSKEKRTKKI